MYLTEIDKATGLIKVDKRFDGVYAIKEFREILNDPKLGIEVMTCIALVADWLSEIRYFRLKDRPKKAMRIVRDKHWDLDWNIEPIQKALKKYEELQYNPDLVEKRMLDEMLQDLLVKIKDAKKQEMRLEYFKQLDTVKGLIQTWNKNHVDDDPMAQGPVDNGYSLSRLEEKAMDRKSFYNV